MARPGLPNTARVPLEASPGASEAPGLLLATALFLLVLLLLPQVGGGYSGAGYQLGFVVLPAAALIALLSGARLPALAAGLLCGQLLTLVLLPLWLQPGQALWFYLLQIPCAWALTWIALRHAPSRAGLLLPVVGIAALLSALYGHFLWLGAGRLDYYISSSFGLHNAYAGYLLLAWPATAAAALVARRPALRWLFGLGSAFLAATLVLTYSKASIACLLLQLLALAACLIWLSQRRAGKAGGLRSLGAGLAGAALLAVGLLALPTVRDALSRMSDFSGYSMQGRLRFWQAALEIFRDHPLLGVGPGAFAYVYPQYQRDWMYYSVDPHSWPLQLLCELGSLGLLILLAVLLGTGLWVRRLLRSLSETGQAAAQPEAGMALAQRAILLILLISAVLASLLHAAFDFDYTFGATTSLLGVLLAYGSFISRPPQPEGSASASEAPAARFIRLATALLLAVAVLAGEFMTLERYTLDSLRNPALALETRLSLLESAIRANPRNARSHYDLASTLAQSGRAAPGGQPDRLSRAAAELDASIRLNPRYAQAWALRGLLKQQRDPEAANRDLGRAVELDPYNYPDHYFYWAAVAPDDAERLRRLELGMQRIPAEEPLPPDALRPEWYRLNPMFGQMWEEMSRLTSVPRNKELYQRRADAFKEAVRKAAQAERDAAEAEQQATGQ